MNARILIGSSIFTLVPLAASCSGEGAPSVETAPAPFARTAWAPIDRTGARLRRSTANERARPRAVDRPAPSADASIPAKYQAFASAFEAEMASYGAPGSAVAILEHGEVTFAHGFGTKGPNSAEPVDASTLFRIGSLSKALTATAALHLVDEGRGSLDEDVSHLIPGVSLPSPLAERLELRHLLSQQSGLFDFTNFSPDPEVDSLFCPSAGGALGQFVRGSLFSQAEFFMAPPGAAWTYSNPNYVLAGAAVESMSGMEYTRAMRSLVFDPLGMTRTFLHPSDVLADGDYADGLSVNPDGTPWDVAPDAYDCGWQRPAGLAFSSVLDWAKFVEFLYRGDRRVLSDRSRIAMQSKIANTYLDGNLEGYGYGLEVGSGYDASMGGATKFYHAEYIMHRGGIAGFSAIYYFFPRTGFGFIAFGSTDGAYPFASLASALESFSGIEPSKTLPESARPDAPTFPRYAGTFEDGSGIFGQFTVSEDQGTFHVSFPELDALGIPYETTLSEYAEYGFTTTIGAVPVAATTALVGELLYPGGFPMGLDFVPGRERRFDWVMIDPGLPSLAAGRVESDTGP